MSKPIPPQIVRWSVQVYCWLLRGYPATFYRAYAAQMAQLFQDLCCDRYQQAGARGVVGLWFTASGDLLVNVGREMMMQRLTTTNPDRWYGAVYGMIIGVILIAYQVISLYIFQETLSNLAWRLLPLGLLGVCGLAGFYSGQRSGTIVSGLGAGAIAGAVSAALLVIVMLLIIMFYPAALRQIPAEVQYYLRDYKQMGVSSFEEYEFWETFGGGFICLVLFAAVGALFGGLGGLIAKWQLHWRANL